MKSMRWFAAVAAVVVSCLAFAGSALTLPADWRSWQHVKSMVIPDKAHGLYGFHHVYVHPKALAAYQKGKGYPEGALLAVPFYDVVVENGATSQGPLLKVAVMKRDKTATATGGWLYGAFDSTGKALELDARAGCHTCHEAKKDRDFVFSEWTP
ncbi:MAG: cytochrome P460 family protein [Myxococcaceae bacterium]|nr:cytochrome P460 family protein [Myxococcaceae bacterium]